MAAKKTVSSPGVVAAQVVGPEETNGLVFGRNVFARRGFRPLLEALLDAPKGSTLKAPVSSKTSIRKAVAAMNLEAVYAAAEGFVYVRITGGNAETTNEPIQAKLLAELRGGVKTAKELARAVGVFPSDIRGPLGRLVRDGKIQEDGGAYRKI